MVQVTVGNGVVFDNVEMEKSLRPENLGQREKRIQGIRLGNPRAGFLAPEAWCCSVLSIYYHQRSFRFLLPKAFSLKSSPMKM